MHSFQIPQMDSYLRRETCQTEVEMLTKWWVVLRACFFVLSLFMLLLLSLLFHYYYCYGNNITLLIDIVITIITKSSVIMVISTVEFAWQRCSRYAIVSSFMLFYTCTFFITRYFNKSWTILELLVLSCFFDKTSTGKCWSGFLAKPSIFKQPPEKACYFHDVTMVVTNRQHGRHI